MADDKPMLGPMSGFWQIDNFALVGSAHYANAIRESLLYLTPTLRELADGFGVNYRTLQSYAAMERVGPPEFGEQLEKHLRVRIHNLTACADFLAKLLAEHAQRQAMHREAREQKEQRIRELEKRLNERDREFLQRWGPGPYSAKGVAEREAQVKRERELEKKRGKIRP